MEVDVGIDVGDFQARPAPPVRRQHGPGGSQQVGPHFALGCRQPQRTESRSEDLRSEILGVGTVPHLAVHQPVQTADIVEIGRVPVWVGGGVERCERDDMGSLVLTFCLLR